MKNHLFTFKSSSATDFFNTLAFLQKEELPEQEEKEEESQE